MALQMAYVRAYGFEAATAIAVIDRCHRGGSVKSVISTVRLDLPGICVRKHIARCNSSVCPHHKRCCNARGTTFHGLSVQLQPVWPVQEPWSVFSSHRLPAPPSACAQLHVGCWSSPHWQLPLGQFASFSEQLIAVEGQFASVMPTVNERIHACQCQRMSLFRM